MMLLNYLYYEENYVIVLVYTKFQKLKCYTILSLSILPLDPNHSQIPPTILNHKSVNE